jgi:hypothetical protein
LSKFRFARSHRLGECVGWRVPVRAHPLPHWRDTSKLIDSLFHKWAAEDSLNPTALNRIRHRDAHMWLAGVEMNGENKIPALILLDAYTAYSWLLKQFLGVPALYFPRLLLRNHHP